MFKQAAWAAISLMELVGQPAKLIKHDTAPLPVLTLVQESKKRRASRKKHICHWTDQEVWGAVLFALIVGVLIGICI